MEKLREGPVLCLGLKGLDDDDDDDEYCYDPQSKEVIQTWTVA
jgi:hypothetical protein